LDPRLAKCLPQAFMLRPEFAHLHPPHDGSFQKTAPAVTAHGWGELRPVVRMGLLSPIALMVYGPRDRSELETVWLILRTSYAFARGTSTEARPSSIM